MSVATFGKEKIVWSECPPESKLLIHNYSRSRLEISFAHIATYDIRYNAACSQDKYFTIIF